MTNVRTIVGRDLEHLNALRAAVQVGIDDVEAGDVEAGDVEIIDDPVEWVNQISASVSAPTTA